jgi:hypothetical protein
MSRMDNVRQSHCMTPVACNMSLMQARKMQKGSRPRWPSQVCCTALYAGADEDITMY